MTAGADEGQVLSESPADRWQQLECGQDLVEFGDRWLLTVDESVVPAEQLATHG